ncbi:MAG: A/G-specific adenine glycosylase [Saprospiraceae bacterium]|nr:A/G-specific adenine glycosylase [Saprospiraceae bacterium]MCF8251052.1 A/G-specific adenine glycosylase [Saprospiraceae bacterium]MCF8280337.1 A/G-specific adenine glycosylase [Bacteroidales bacterium]MCF8312892.1 A/G-specific adenine glycosylase [Saprospiraceae bacterium]MCF8441311.1 A/G-specific adenine glycosylase [Saprospiraceae bacterium]
MATTNRHLFFTINLLDWHSGHHRPMPWKGERNPYLVWLSEIILQQTRVEQGLPYFERFKAAYPTVTDLANAPEDEAMKLWEGLGYYSRARNLHAAAKHIAHELNGSFPTTYEGIRSLKGIGDYTAAAIASFAYDLPYAVVDGNVYRVLSRFFGMETPIDSTMGKKEFAVLAQGLLEIGNWGIGGETIPQFPISPIPNFSPSGFNQAIMDFGATHCTPATPKCPTCPMQEHCVAFLEKKTGELPVKTKKLVRRQRIFNYLIINRLREVFIKKRTEKDIWQNLYDFPLIETEALHDDRQFLTKNKTCEAWLGESGWQLLRVSPPQRQELTHQRIVATFWELGVGADFLPKEENWVAVERRKLSNFAFPKVIDLYFQQKFLPLELF